MEAEFERSTHSFPHKGWAQNAIREEMGLCNSAPLNERTLYGKVQPARSYSFACVCVCLAVPAGGWIVVRWVQDRRAW